ncbi:trypsin-like serine peptidase [Streptomyces albofaciens]|uniref:trypsin-like serine peptidase n=1 Tax=Streptomyces albofaciens TaxID=66866 RepID=UPI001FCC151A|nr:trypsin-like peptidase domain-containing protein [Streptomyces albofaciens]
MRSARTPVATAATTVTAAAAAMAALVGLTGCGGSSRAADPSQPAARHFEGLPFVGVLFADGEHHCTASVVDSPKGNVLVTAAHCVHFQDDDEDGDEDGDEDEGKGGDPDGGKESGPITGDLQFAPRFSGAGEGTFPYGKWKVNGIHVPRAWQEEDGDRGDYAFLTVEPDAQGRSVQEVVGAATPDWSSGPRRHVTVVGYPNEAYNPDNHPITCATDTQRDDDQPYMMLMRCGGFHDGTSGSPWLADHHDARRPGRLIGVLSGGDTDAESTAVLFDRQARELYERVTGGAAKSS